MKTVLHILTAVVIITLFNSNPVQSQIDFADGVYVRKTNGEREPIAYPHIIESDVMWSKKVWRIIDLREKMNHKLYYPEYPVKDRYSLIDLLLKHIESDQISAYDANANEFDEFVEPITYEEIKLNLGAIDDTIDIPDEYGNISQRVIKGEYNSSEVKQYMVKEEWFFDSERSVLDVRIIGLCPIRFYYRGVDVQKSKLFWVYFPEARKMLANNLVFNSKNDSRYLSFDDIFFKRFYSGYIYQESNTYNNRSIGQYALGIDALVEADRIQNNIRNFEHDLWEY